VTIQPSSDRFSPVFRAAATRTAATPTAALAQAIDAGSGAGAGVMGSSRLSPRGGSFDPPTAAAVTAWRKA